MIFRLLSVSLSLFIFALIASCGGSDESNTVVGEVQADFSALSTDVMPVVDSAIEGLLKLDLRNQSEITSCADDWTCNDVEQGNVAYQLYRLLADADDDPALLAYPDEASFQVSAWGVENLQNELDLMALMTGSLTGEESGTQTETVQGDTFDSEVGGEK